MSNRTCDNRRAERLAQIETIAHAAASLCRMPNSVSASAPTGEINRVLTACRRQARRLSSLLRDAGFDVPNGDAPGDAGDDT